MSVEDFEEADWTSPRTSILIPHGVQFYSQTFEGNQFRRQISLQAQVKWKKNLIEEGKSINHFSSTT
jgi:hypothetical protein